jgi:hypothetical protein
MGRPRTAAVVFGLVIGAVVGLMLAGCSAGPGVSPTPVATSASTPTIAAEGVATPAAPQFHPDGTAKENKAYFDSVASALLASNPSWGGKNVIDALTTAGFDKANMQVTPDKTTIGRAVDSVLFSVRVGTECLLGQLSGSEYTSSVQAALKSGACLVGQTRPINW